MKDKRSVSRFEDFRLSCPTFMLALSAGNYDHDRCVLDGSTEGMNL